MSRCNKEPLRIRLYMHKDPDQPIVFSADGPKVFGLIRRWMDRHYGDDVDGLCLYMHDPARYLSTAHSDIVCIEWDGGYGGWSGGEWSIRRGHDVDDSFSTWQGARAEFLSEVASHGKRLAIT